MKTTFLLLFFLYLHTHCFSQDDYPVDDKNKIERGVDKEYDIPVRGVNLIVLYSKDDDITTYKNIAALLQDKGVFIERGDKDLLTLTTEFTVISGSWKYQLRVRINEGRVYIRSFAEIGNHIATGSGIRASNTGQKKSLNMLAWQKAEELAKAYPGGNIKYKYQQ